MQDRIFHSTTNCKMNFLTLLKRAAVFSKLLQCYKNVPLNYLTTFLRNCSAFPNACLCVCADSSTQPRAGARVQRNLTTVTLSGEKYLPRRGDPSIHTCQDLPFLGIQSGTYSNVPGITKMLEKRSLGMVSGSFNSSQC